jgi:hypothetical protein
MIKIKKIPPQQPKQRSITMKLNTLIHSPTTPGAKDAIHDARNSLVKSYLIENGLDKPIRQLTGKQKIKKILAPIIVQILLIKALYFSK